MTTDFTPFNILLECDGPTRIKRVADRIDFKPESYNQEHWGVHNWQADDHDVDYDADGFAIGDPLIAKVLPPCGSAFCLVGHALLDAGYGAVFDSPGDDEDDADTWKTPDGGDFWPEFESMVIKGAELFGISKRDGKILFDAAWRPSNGLSPAEALRQIADGGNVIELTDPTALKYIRQWDRD